MALEQESTLEDIAREEAEEDALDEATTSIDDDVEIIVEDEEDDTAGAAEPPTTESPPADAAPTDPEPEPVPGEPVVTDADLEETDKAYPESFKKRIKREIRVRRKIEAESAQVRQVAVQAIQYSQARDAELLAANKQLLELRRQHADVLEIAFDRDIQIKSQELRQAREDGNYDTEMKVQSELDTLRFRQNQVREAKRVLPTEVPTALPAPTPAASSPTAEPTRPPASPKAVAWINRNRAWFNTPKFAGHTQFVLGEDEQLVKEGYDKNSDEYYAELDRRVDAAFPTLRKAAPPTNGSGGPPVAPVGGLNGSKSAAKGAIKLNKADLANMRRFGLDPSNKEHLREYARSKRS